MKKGREKDRLSLPPFVPLPWQLLNSQAFIELPPSAGKALPYFLGKVRKLFNDPQKYFIEFSFSYREGKKVGFALGTFSKIIRDLISHGFISPIEKGGLRGDCKSSNIFKLSSRWEAYGTQDFQAVDWDRFLSRE